MDRHKDSNRLKLSNDSLETEKSSNRGQHPNSQANLKPFEKGVSGNPDGRPSKHRKLKEALKPYGEQKSTRWGCRDQTKKEVVLNRVWEEAESGSVPHLKLLAELELLDAE